MPALLADREKMVTSAKVPTVTIARMAFGDAPVKLLLRSHLHSMAVCMGVTSTPEAMDSVIEDVMSGYGDLKVTEVLLAFKMIREGKFRTGDNNRGAFYGSLSSDVICDCLYKFRTDYRNPILARLEKEQKPKEEPAASYDEYSVIIVNSIMALRHNSVKMGQQFQFFKTRLKQEDMLQLEKYIEEQQKLLADIAQVKKQVADLEYMQRAIKTTATITDPTRRDACFVRLLELANQYDEKYAPLEPPTDNNQ